MATIAITVQVLKGNYTIPTANQLDLTFTAADVALGNHYAATGKEFVIVQNSDPTNAYTFTLTSQPDTYGRTGDVTAYSLAAGEIGMYGPIPIDGWRNAAGQVLISGSNAAIKFAIVRSA
jgi:hypothetical protein